MAKVTNKDLQYAISLQDAKRFAQKRVAGTPKSASPSGAPRIPKDYAKPTASRAAPVRMGLRAGLSAGARAGGALMAPIVATDLIKRGVPQRLGRKLGKKAYKMFNK